MKIIETPEYSRSVPLLTMKEVTCLRFGFCVFNLLFFIVCLPNLLVETLGVEKEGF